MENRDMNKAICRCKRIFFEDLEQAIANGASSFEEVQAATKAAAGCKRCKKDVQELVEHLLKQKK